MRKPLTVIIITLSALKAVADPGGPRGPWLPPGPVKIGHKKDGHRRRLHRFHVSRPPLTWPLDPLLKGHVETVDTKDQSNAIVYGMFVDTVDTKIKACKCIECYVCLDCRYWCLRLLHNTLYRVL